MSDATPSQEAPLAACTARTQAGHPCPFKATYQAPDGAGLCVAHAARSGDPAAMAEQQARLQGYKARRPIPRRRKPLDAAQARRARIRELTRLAEKAEKKGDLQLRCRYEELLAPLLAADSAPPAPGTPAAAAAAKPREVPLAALSDAALDALELLAKEVKQYLETATPTPAPAAQPVTATTTISFEKEPDHVR